MIYTKTVTVDFSESQISLNEISITAKAIEIKDFKFNHKAHEEGIKLKKKIRDNLLNPFHLWSILSQSPLQIIERNASIFFL